MCMLDEIRAKRDEIYAIARAHKAEKLWVFGSCARKEEGGGCDMRVYLDNCCYNRPFDDQSQVRVVLETIAKLNIQQQMRDGALEYVWSSVLDFEISKSRFIDRALQITPWANGAIVNIAINDAIRYRAKEFESAGLKPMDALHIACAESAGCDWFFTTDRGILKKAHVTATMRIANPLDFFGGNGYDAD